MFYETLILHFSVYLCGGGLQKIKKSVESANPPSLKTVYWYCTNSGDESTNTRTIQHMENSPSESVSTFTKPSF